MERKANLPVVGLLFVVNGKPSVEGIPWTECPSIAGFRTHGLGHPEFWERSQQSGAAPKDTPYEECP